MKVIAWARVLHLQEKYARNIVKKTLIDLKNVTIGNQKSLRSVMLAR